MAKPDIDDIRWAQDPAALTVATTSAQWELGWVAPGGVEEKPILNYQNYWQNAVQQWIEWTDGAVPDVSSTEFQIVDLYEWTTGHQDFNRFPFQATPVSTVLGQTGNDLRLSFMPTVGAVANNWVSQKSDTWVGARYYELNDIFLKGLGLQVNDGNGDTWVMYVSTPSPPHFIAPLVSSLAPGTGLDIRFNGFSFNMTVLKNGVSQSTPFFSSFAEIEDLAATNLFSSLNPNGWRVVLPGVNEVSLEFANSTRGNVRGLETKRRWIRPLDVSSTTAVTQLDNSCRWDVTPSTNAWNSALRINYNISFLGSGIDYMRISADATQNARAASIGMPPAKTDPSIRGTAFPVVFGFGDLVLAFNSGKGFKRVIGTVSLSDLYGQAGPNNWIQIEELY